MANMGCAKTCIDPSPFLFTLENFISRSGRSSFVVNSQQDAAEVLEHVLNELMGDSVVAGSTTAIKNRISISCNCCFNSLQTEDICFVLQLTVCSDIQTSLNSIFISEHRLLNFCWGLCNITNKTNRRYDIYTVIIMI